MADLYEWDVEDEEFWESTGKKIGHNRHGQNGRRDARLSCGSS